MATPSVVNLAACVEDSRLAVLNGDTGPSDPTDFHQLLGRLQAVRNTLPPLYYDSVFAPYVHKLEALGPMGFMQILLRDPDRQQEAGLMLDIAHAILQNGEHYQARATDGFQEVISDLYDGFLSAEDRRGVLPPDRETIPPLVKWGNPSSGPYTWPVEATSSFGVKVGIVNLPPANNTRGIMAWAALGHETAGHDILSADIGLRAQLADALFRDLTAADLAPGLATYWADRIDETASDVMGILNMGYAAGIGLIGYFRGISAAYTGIPKLRSHGPAADPHPADVLRGYVAARTVATLSFSEAAGWAELIDAETERDVETIHLAGRVISKEIAKRSAEVVAEAITATRLNSLENHALGDIQDWREADEAAADAIGTLLTTVGPVPNAFLEGTYAAHVVAAGVRAALEGGANIPLIFDRMLATLKLMHDRNPSWGPLFVRHPGDLAMHRTYIRP